METEASTSKQRDDSLGHGNKEEIEIENEEESEGRDRANGTENGKSLKDVKVVAEEDKLAENGKQVQGQDIAEEHENLQSVQDVKDVSENEKSGDDMKGVAEKDQSANLQVEQLQQMLAEENTQGPTQSDILPSNTSTEEDNNPLEISIDDEKDVQLEHPSQGPLPSVSSVLDKGMTYSEKKSIGEVENEDRSVKPDRALSAGLEIESAERVIDVVTDNVDFVNANDTDVLTKHGKEAVIPDEKPFKGNKEAKGEDDMETSKDHYEGLAALDIKTSIELEKDPVKIDTELVKKDKRIFNLETDSSIEQHSGRVIPEPETSTGQVNSIIKLDTETVTEQGNVPPNPDSEILDVPPTKMLTEANQETPRLDAETVTNITEDFPGCKVQSDYRDVSVIADPAAEGYKKYSTGAPKRNAGDAEDASIKHTDLEPGTPYVRSSNLKHEEGGDLTSHVLGLDSTPVTSVGVSNSKDCFLLDEMSEGTESGAEEEQSAFVKELEHFFRERSMEFKPPKFYGQELNCLKLWRAVIRLGGYEKVTSCKLWQQVGESFRPPKTCTTVSWTFQSFYVKALLDYERHKASGGEPNIPIASDSEPIKNQNRGSGSGRVTRHSAARAMQGLHSQSVDIGQVGDPVTKDKNSIPPQKRKKHLGRAGRLKRKTPPYTEHPVKTSRAKLSKTQVDVNVVDEGIPANWVNINVQRTKDCFEVYALVPGLLHEEVRVQSDPVGQVVISGEPKKPDNPWGIRPFKKVINLPSRVDPQQTSASLSLSGQLFVRVPFEKSE